MREENELNCFADVALLICDIYVPMSYMVGYRGDRG